MSSLKPILFYLCLFTITTIYIGYLNLRGSPQMKLVEREFQSFLRPDPAGRKDNFLEIEDSRYLNLLINTSNCKVPEFSPWDSSVIPFAHKPEPFEDCRKIHFHWSYRDGNELVLNETAMKENGYEFNQVSCCYKAVTRIEQTLQNYDLNAENVIKYSDCIELSSLRTYIKTEEFLVVECTGLLNVVYRGFHGFAQIHQPDNDISSKIKYWKNKLHFDRESVLPPNILVIGTDTTSRLNFRRNMAKTAEVLERFGAVEMMGYTKAGESTHNAFATILTGYDSTQLEGTCHPFKEGNYDQCPLIWKRFEASSYLTSHSEDWPDLNAFNHNEAGFVEQPTDFYIRTLMIAAHDFGLPAIVNRFVRLSTMWCLGYQTNDELLLDYTESVLDLAYDQKTPVFAWSWSSTYPHHHDHNVLQLVDPTYSDFLERIEAKGYLDNTILIFLSDHGQRYGPLRETLTGWYEDRMPNLWIRIPEYLKGQFPEWQEALEINSRLVASPYTLYSTLNHILNTIAPNSPQPEELLDSKTNHYIPRRFTQNFFHPLEEENSCEDVGVPDNFCACYPLSKVELNDPILQAAGLATLNHLNSKLPQECAKLKIGKITGGALMDKSKSTESSGKLIYIIGFLTNPGNLLLEAQIDFYPQNKSFPLETSSILRANKINPDHVKCTNDNWVQLYCFCTGSS